MLVVCVRVLLLLSVDMGVVVVVCVFYGVYDVDGVVGVVVCCWCC